MLSTILLYIKVLSTTFVFFDGAKHLKEWTRIYLSLQRMRVTFTFDAIK